MPSNLCQLHRSTCERMGQQVALRHKRHGMYHDISWSDYRRQSDWVAAGLIGLGLNHGDRIAMLSENRYEWLITDHGILSCGCVHVPLHAPLAPKQVEFQVGHSEARAIFVSSQAQADKIFKVLDNLPLLEFLISFEAIDSPSDKIQCLTWEGLKHRGRQSLETAAPEISHREDSLTGDDLSSIIYTSGTTGNPKGVMLTHNNLLTNAMETGRIAYLEPDDCLLSWLPYSHIYARCVDHYLTTTYAIVVALAESIDTLVTNLAEIQPTWLTSVPRFYEKTWASVETLGDEDRDETLRKIFGPNIRQLTSGGAPLPPTVCKAFFNAGLPLLEGYGLTETAPVISFNSIENYKIGSVGQTIRDVEAKIADDGEILTRGPHVMAGYWKNEDATNKAIVDGWFHTGDIGSLDDDGYLTITDRKKDLFVTSAGKNVAPAILEHLLKSEVCIDQAVVYGDGRQFISALIVPNFVELQKVVDASGWSLSLNEEFVQDEDVNNYFDERIRELMKSVSQPERVKRFLILSRLFQVEDDELTATLKVRRSHIIGKYEASLAKLYE